MNLGNLIKPLGIITYSFLVLTILTAILKMKFKVKWINVKWHSWFGILTLIFATIHTIIVIYLNYF